MHRLHGILLFVFLALAPGLKAGPEPLFDGKTFAGWEGNTGSLWRIEDGALAAGSLEKDQAKNDFLATVKSFENFDLKLKWKLEGTKGFVNGGVQFRSKRIPNNHEVIGYQADLGTGYDGALYDESRRNKILAQPSQEVLLKARKPLGEWNDYRIRAEGARIQIWLNGVQTVDFTETDASVSRTGMIAVQIHGGATSIVRYKDLMIEELPASQDPSVSAPATAEGPASRMTEKLPPPVKLSPFVNGQFALGKDDVVVFTGSENMVLEQRAGAIETQLAAQWKEATPRFRHMSWEGDTVFRQNRMMEWGSWPMNLEAAGATVVVAWFGQVEAMNPIKSVEEFTKSYASLLDSFAQRTPRIVLIGPPPFEKPQDPNVPDNTGLNDRVRALNEATRKLAQDRGLVFVDLFQALSQPHEPLTRDGLHFTDKGLGVVGEIVGKALGATAVPDESLRLAVVEKNRLWFDTWRCMNWAFAFGDRDTMPFAKGAGDHAPFAEELKRFQPLLAHAEAAVHALAAGKPAPAPLPPPPPRADPPALSAAEQMARFNLREGFATNLFADESLGVVRPIQIRWDERGRLWVACTPSYPQLQPGEHGNDYILVLEDTDGDGRADKATRFAEHLTMPMGFEFAPKSVGGGLYVCESTQLVHLPDRNADDKADGSHVVLSGFGTGDTHQDANSLRWGPDGCLWFTQGYHIWSYVETPHGLSELNRSGVWRFNPRTLQLTSFLNESAAGANCWGTAWDDYGQCFHGSGADISIWHTTPAMIPTLHPHALPTAIASSRGKSMEPEILGSSHLPESLRGVLLKNTYYTNQIHLYRLVDAGSSFRSEEMGVLMSGENEFRPVETRVGPDGALYVCDWLNPVIGHYQASYRDPRRDQSHGRIWRITAKDRPLVKRPALGGMNASQLIERLGSPERWERDAAKFALYRLDSAEVIPAANAALLVKYHSDEMRMLYELSGVLAAHESANESIVTRLMASSDFRYRAWGTHLVGVWAGKLENPLGLLQKAITDEHPRVRLEAVVASAWMPPQLAPEAMKIATLALEKPMDQALTYSMTQCIHALAPYWKPALAQGRLDFGDRFHALARVLMTVGDQGTVSKIRDLLSSDKVPPASRENLLSVLIQYGSDRDLEFALAQAPQSQVVLSALVAAARNRPKADFGNGLQQLMASSHPAARIAACRIVATRGKDWGTADQIAQLLADDGASSDERIAAMAAIAKLRGKAALPELLNLTRSSDAALRSGALAITAPLDTSAIARLSAELLANAKSTADVAPLFSPLLEQRDGPTTLADALANQKPSAEVAILAIRWMTENGRDDAPVRNVLNAAAGVVSSTQIYSDALVKRLASDAAGRGDAVRGAAVYAEARSTCASCHKVGDVGGILGPDLSAIGRAMTPEAIVESVLWPKRQVKEGFMLTQITTKDGRMQAGYIASDTKEALTLKDMAGNPMPPIGRQDIATRSDTGTLMPDGLTAWMTEQQQLDLLRYLFELGK